MRKLILILFVGLFTTSVYGQLNKQINIPKYKNRDTTLWLKWLQELKLPYLISNTDSFHFRFWTDGQAVDIWTNDYKIFYGLLTNYTNTYEPYDMKKKERKPSITFSSHVQLDTSSARQTFELIKTISPIPTDDSIKGWEMGLDGITYCFETSTPTIYSFKSYWEPTSQDSTLIEAKQIQTFVDRMYLTFNLKTEYNKFFATLKPGSYTSGGAMVTTKLNEKQAMQMKRDRPNREYLDSVKDTLNHYLSDTLTKLMVIDKGLSCYNQFFLKFSTNNNLIKITTNEKFNDHEDRVDYRKCKRKIKEAFKKVKVDFIKCKREYWKEFSYWENKVTILQ